MHGLAVGELQRRQLRERANGTHLIRPQAATLDETELLQLPEKAEGLRQVFHRAVEVEIGELRERRKWPDLPTQHVQVQARQL